MFESLPFLRKHFPRAFFHLAFPSSSGAPHLELGQLGETHVAHRLRAAGWRILAQKALTPSGEIDLVAIQDNVLVLVEVKSGLWPMGKRKLDLDALRWRPGHRFDREQYDAYRRALPQLQTRLPGGPVPSGRIDLIEVFWRHGKLGPALVHHVDLQSPLCRLGPVDGRGASGPHGAPAP